MQAQMSTSSKVYLDAPQSTCATKLGASGNGSLAGTVVDSNHNPLAGAQVHLERDGSAGSCDVATELDGRFLFEDLRKGTFRLRIWLSGMQTLMDEQITLQNGQHLTLPDLTVRLATATQQVTVTVSRVELAQEEVKTQEKQRALVIFPNFYSSYIWNAAPLNSRQKFDLALHSIFDPVNFLVVGAEQASCSTPIRITTGQERKPTRNITARPSPTRRSPTFSAARCFRRFCTRIPVISTKAGAARRLALYAISRAVITRNDAGRDVPNYSSVAGSLMAGAISNAYHPATDRGVGLTFRNGAIAIGGHAFENLIREFILRQLTSHVPEPGVGEPPPK
jgi:hypothetical protein